MEYRYAFWMRYVVQNFSRAIELLTLWVILNQFRQIQGWEYYEIVFLYTLNLLSFGLGNFFVLIPMRRLEGMVQLGTFDNLLVYPLNPLLHLIARNFSTIFIGHLALGGILLVICFGQLSINWTIAKFAWFALVVIGAALIQASITMIAGTMAFWFVKSQALINTLLYSVKRFVEYPITIYDTWLQVVLTFLIPYAFVNFYPAQGFLSKTGESVFHPIFQYGTPVVGIMLSLLAYRLWCLGINHYESTGS
jgi:ABC-2 type transport system permease protein